MKETTQHSRTSTTSVENKTYKVSPFYRLLFNSIVSLHDKAIMNEFVIKEHLKYDKVDNIKKLIRPELIEKMVDDLDNSSTPIEPINERLDSERIQALKKVLKDENLTLSSTFKTGLNARLQKPIITKIHQIHKEYTEHLGEALELAIANYVYESDEDYFRVVLFFFTQMVRSEAKKSTI